MDHTEAIMELRSFVTLIAAFVFMAQRSRACAPTCSGDDITSQQAVNKTIERGLVSGVEEAQWRGMCHSFCVTVSRCHVVIYHVMSVQARCMVVHTGSSHCMGFACPFIANLILIIKMTIAAYS